MRNLARLAARIYNTPLMIEEEKGQILVDVFQRYENERISVSAEIAEEIPPTELVYGGVQAVRADGGYLVSNNGVAIIPVLGSLVQRGSSMDSMSGLTSYSKLASQLDAAMADRSVRAIVFEVDSPGGESNGIFELSKTIREASKTKPVMSIANEIAFSGGQVILSSAPNSFVTESGMVGSVGVVMYHMDRSKQLEKQGVTVTPIFAGKRKVQFSQHQALDADALAWAQDSVNRTYDRFANNIALHRNISVESIKGTEAALLHSDQALQLKFVDGTATLSDVVNAASDKAMRKIHNIGTGAAVNALNSQEQIGMDTKQGNTAATAPNTDTAAGTTAAAPAPAATAAAPAANTAAAERQRVAGILNCEEAKGREKLAQYFATQTELSVEAARAALGAAALETTTAPNALAAAMAAHGTAGNKVGAASGGTANGDASSSAPPVIDANAIFKRRKMEAENARRKHGGGV